MPYVVSGPLSLFALLLVPRKSSCCFSNSFTIKPRLSHFPWKPAWCQPELGAHLDAPRVKQVKTHRWVRVWPTVLKKWTVALKKKVIMMCTYKLWPKIKKEDIVHSETVWHTNTETEKRTGSVAHPPRSALSLAGCVMSNSVLTIATVFFNFEIEKTVHILHAIKSRCEAAYKAICLFTDMHWK